MLFEKPYRNKLNCFRLLRDAVATNIIGGGSEWKHILSRKKSEKQTLIQQYQEILNGLVTQRSRVDFSRKKNAVCLCMGWRRVLVISNYQYYYKVFFYLAFQAYLHRALHKSARRRSNNKHEEKYILRFVFLRVLNWLLIHFFLTFDNCLEKVSLLSISIPKISNVPFTGKTKKNIICITKD